MALYSMTAFARADVEHAGWHGSFEVKSVNGRGLDVRVRVPAILDGFDIHLKKHAGTRLDRGTVFVNLTLRESDQADDFKIDEARLARLVALAGTLRDRPEIEPARLDGLMRLPGVIESGLKPLEKEDRAALETVLHEAFDGVLSALIEAREREGDALEEALEQALDRISELTARAEGCADRLAIRLGELLDADRIDPRRLEEEVALLALKLDVREEIDRLRAHLVEARSLIAGGSPVGRRLDFLAQEFNREANTLCAKASDTDLTQTGLALKAAIDQFREQVQNVE